LLKEVIRPISRVAILGDPVLNAPQFQATAGAARALAIEPQLVEVRGSRDFDTALEAAGRGRAGAVLLLSSPLVFTGRVKISALALKRRLPAVSMFVEFAEAGGVMAYGPSLREAFWRSGAYAGRILQGAKPGELPVQRPTKFELVINLKTAKALRPDHPPVAPATGGSGDRSMRTVVASRASAHAALPFGAGMRPGAIAQSAQDRRSRRRQDRGISRIGVQVAMKSSGGPWLGQRPPTIHSRTDAGA